MMTEDLVLIFDFGSQFAQLIARRVRELNVFCQIVRHDLPAERVKELKPRGLIFSGGPMSVYDAGAPKCDPALFDLNIPVLGTNGLQPAAQTRVACSPSTAARESGRAELHRRRGRRPHGSQQQTTVWMSHGDRRSHEQRFHRPRL